MADVERKRVTLHPVKEDGTIDLSVSLYPKTFVDGIVDREGNEVDIALQNELDTKVADLNNKINLTNEAIGIFGTKIDELVEKESAFEEKIDEKVEELADDIPAEVERATTAEEALAEQITATTATLNTKIDTEISTVNQALKEEANIRKALDTTLNAKIESEENRATSAETNLDTKIDNAIEQLNTTIATTETELIQVINAEADERLNTDTELREAIQSEANYARVAEEQLNTAINDINEQLSGAINEEITRATGVEADLSGKLNDEITDRELAIDEVQAAITTESTRATGAESAINEQVSTLSANLTAEISNREEAERNIHTEIIQETSRAGDAETALGTRITNEIAAEREARETATGGISEAIEAAVEELEATDEALDVRLTTTEATLASEASTRETADAGLQRQIDAMASRSDVVDVVANKAALDEYDTSSLFNNDVIKVLNDETQSNKTTYYKYNKDTNSFSLIGSIGPYSTATNVTNGDIDGSANVETVSDNIKSVTNKGYVDTKVNSVLTQVQNWEMETQEMLNLRLNSLDESVVKAYYCNVFLKSAEAISCHGLKYNSSEEFISNTDRTDKGNIITSITFSFKYNKLPRGCKLYIKELTKNLEFPAIEVTREVEGRIVEVNEYTITGLNLTKTSMWQLSLLSEYDGSISTKVVPVYICNKVYWGTAMLVDGGIALPEWQSEVSPIFATNKPVVSGDGRYIIYAFPVPDHEALDYGIPMFTLSPSQFVGGVSQYALGETLTFNFTNSDNNYREDYYIYMSDNSGLGNITLKVERQ